MDNRETLAALSAEDRLAEIAAEARAGARQIGAQIERAVQEGDDRRVLDLDHMFQTLERIVKLCGVAGQRRR